MKIHIHTPFAGRMRAHRSAWKFSFPLLALVAVLTLSGCMQSRPVPYSFVTAEEQSASMNFTQGNPGVSFVAFGDKPLPEPEKGTYWDQMTFPAEKPLAITVRAKYAPESGGSGGSMLGALVGTAVKGVKQSLLSVDKEIVFNVPPLEAGGVYTLSFQNAGVLGKNTLVLRDMYGREIQKQVF